MPGGRMMVRRAMVALIASPVLAVGAAPPAAADPAPPACEDGVTVVVDYNELGGEDRRACVDAGTAGDAFDQAGFALEYVPRMQNFVCRVTGVPADGPCTGTDAYWSLWWSDGTSEWTYASLGVSSLEVPEGGSVGFAWHEGNDDAAAPDVAVGAAGDAGAAPETAGSESPSGETSAAEPSEDGSRPLWAIAAVAGVVLLAAAAPIVVRRRRTA